MRAGTLPPRDNPRKDGRAKDGPSFFLLLCGDTVFLRVRYEGGDVAAKPKGPQVQNTETVRSLLNACPNPGPLFGVVELQANYRDHTEEPFLAGVYVEARDVERLLLSVVASKDLPVYVAEGFARLYSLDVPTLPAFALLDTDRPCYVLLQFSARDTARMTREGAEG